MRNPLTLRSKLFQMAIMLVILLSVFGIFNYYNGQGNFAQGHAAASLLLVVLMLLIGLAAVGLFFARRRTLSERAAPGNAASRYNLLILGLAILGLAVIFSLQNHVLP